MPRITFASLGSLGQVACGHAADAPCDAGAHWRTRPFTHWATHASALDSPTHEIGQSIGPFTHCPFAPLTPNQTIFPGFILSSGSSARLMARMTSTPGP